MKHIKISTSEAKKVQHKYHPEMVIDLDSSDDIAKPPAASQKEAEMIEFNNLGRNVGETLEHDDESFNSVKYLKKA